MRFRHTQMRFRHTQMRFRHAQVRFVLLKTASQSQGAAAKATAPWGEWDVRERPAPYLVTATLVPLTM